VAEPDFQRWLGEGRITADCHICAGDNQWRPATRIFPELAAPRPTPAITIRAESFRPRFRPHRGPLILTLGLIGIFTTCFIPSIMAWVMGFTRPLGCRATVTLPQHVILHSVAVGHRHTVDKPPVRQPRWTLTRANGPMGGLVAPVPEVLAFAAMHLDGGRAADGSDILAPAAVASMQDLHIDTPVPGEAQALGWTVRPWGGLMSLGLDANTFGQRAVLRLVPERRFAVCVTANSPRGGVLAQSMLGHLAADLLEVTAPDPGDPVGDPGTVSGDDLAATAGEYDRLHQHVEVTVDDGGMRVATEPSGVLQALGLSAAVLDVSPTGHDDTGALTAVGTDPTTGQREVVVIVPATTTQPAALYLGGRLHRRIS
jgi:hypothetical protein